MSLPCLYQDISTCSAFLERPPVSNLHPRTFLPRNLLCWVLCLCHHVSHNGSWACLSLLGVIGRGRPSHSCRDKGKGPLELAGGQRAGAQNLLLARIPPGCCGIRFRGVMRKPCRVHHMQASSVQNFIRQMNRDRCTFPSPMKY